MGTCHKCGGETSPGLTTTAADCAYDVLDLAEDALNGQHKWERVPFSTHHGWKAPDWNCRKCRKTLESVEKEDLPTEWCDYHPPGLMRALADEVRRLRG